MLPLPVQTAARRPVCLAITPPTFLDLPPDVIHHILLQLGVESTRDCSLVCRNLSAITRKDGLWQRLYFRDFRYQPKQNNTQSFLQAYQECHPAAFNLKKGRFTWETVAELDEIRPGASSMFCMSNSKLCIEHPRAGITVQDLATNEQFSLPIAPQGWFSSNMMAIHKNHLFSATENRTVNIYNLDTKEHLKTLGPYMGCVTFTLCDNKLIINPNQGGKILIWDIDSQVFSDPIPLGLNEMILSMAPFQNKLFLGTITKIVVLDIATKSVHMLPMGENTRMIFHLIVSENKLIAGSINGDITIWDIDTEENLLDISCLQLNSLFAVNEKLFSAHSNHNIKIWNIQTGECLSSLCTHASNQIRVIDNKIFSGSFSDKKIRVCDFSKNKHAILANAAELFRQDEVRIAMAQFNALPTDLKNSVYGELYQLLKPFADDYLGCGEHAFHGKNGLSSTGQQKAQAIENYLAKHASS